ncbi:PIN domain-like protein, partial [Pluteus cervinus]
MLGRQLQLKIQGRSNVEISPLLCSCVAASKGHGPHAQAGENPELKIFFFKLCRFLSIPAIFVFVFDGPERPPIKRNTQILSKQTIWLIPHLKTLIRAFGFHVHDAPGEAEAELAKLNRRCLIDAVYTSDSDSLVFGAQLVLRSIDKDSRDDVLVYTADRLESQNKIQLTQGGLLLIALLVGGDYDPSGV